MRRKELWKSEEQGAAERSRHALPPAPAPALTCPEGGSVTHRDSTGRAEVSLVKLSQAMGREGVLSGSMLVLLVSQSVIKMF